MESVDKVRGRTQYAYDPVGQLLSMVPEKARAELFRYDPAGNLHGGTEGAGERVYGPGNRLLRQGNTEFVWDWDGRLVEKKTRDAVSEKEEVWRYSWDMAGLLKQVERPDGVRVDFGYDPFARRVWKRVTKGGASRFERIGVSSTRFIWDGDVLVHELEARAREGGDPVVEERTYWFEEGGFAPVAHMQRREGAEEGEGAAWLHYVNDPIGTPERLIGSDGSVACELRRSAWGKTQEEPGGKASTRIRFQGQYEDEETGLCYNRFRYYDAEAGRFVSADPCGLVASLNQHLYVRSPIGRVDPFGLSELKKGDPLPADAVIHRIGGGDVENLELKPGERKLNPPGISSLQGGRPCDAAADMRRVFPKATKLQEQSKTVGTATAADIRAAGFDVIHDPTGNFPNHARIIHPDGAAGFTPENLAKLSNSLNNSSNN